MMAPMKRTQIQFTEKQLQTLRELAAQRGVSVSSLVREAVETYAKAEVPTSRDQKTSRAIAAAGRFRSGTCDVSRRHDQYLVDAYAES